MHLYLHLVVEQVRTKAELSHRSERNNVLGAELEGLVGKEIACMRMGHSKSENLH